MKAKKPCGEKKAKKDATKLSSFEDFGKFFKIPAQKFRVLDMRLHFPRGKDTELAPITPKEVFDLCSPHIGCGLRMRMRFVISPDEAGYKKYKKKK